MVGGAGSSIQSAHCTVHYTRAGILCSSEVDDNDYCVDERKLQNSNRKYIVWFTSVSELMPDKEVPPAPLGGLCLCLSSVTNCQPPASLSLTHSLHLKTFLC
jgi:hypothetical protein